MLVRTVADERDGDERMSDVEIGRIIGFESARTSRWKHGQIAVVDAARIMALSQAFDIDAQVLLQVAAGYASGRWAMGIIENESKMIRFLGDQLVLPSDQQEMTITGGDGTQARVMRRSAGHYQRRAKRLSGQVRSAEEEEPVVLLVDNDKAVIRTFKNLTGPKTGVRGEIARDAPKAMLLTGELTPGLVLFDLFVGGLDGFACLRAISSDKRAGEAIVVATTLHMNHEITQTAMGCGAAEVIQRPLKPRVLGRLINRIQKIR